MRPGRTLAVVGESGSGKSVTALAILRLTDYTGGQITSGRMMFTPRDGVAVDLARAGEARLEAIRGNEIAMVFQEPMSSLNPVFTVGDQIAEAIVLHQECKPAEARRLARVLLDKVRMPDAVAMLDRYPHQLSGGMHQRVVRGSVLTLRDREFVQSAQSFGVRDWNILWHHLLPNVFGPVLILVTLNVANNILLESSLTFLGLGIDPIIPSWGGMLVDGRSYMQTAWWVSVFPGLAIMATVLGLNLLGDWLRDFLDPTAKV